MINIFFGKTSDDCLDALICKLKLNYKDNRRHIFLVPDRMSVLCEKKIFESLNIQSTLNIEVLTLSRLASRILRDKNAISRTASCMILQKILRDNKDNLKCFNKNQDSDLATTIFGTISQFKSCKVDFNDVSITTNNQLLKDKLDDIALIYKQYQIYLVKRGLFDSLDKLNFLEKSIKDSNFIYNSTFYVSNFDSFTFQGYEIISQISKYCYEFNIGVTNASESVNSHIYNEKYIENILKILNEPNIVNVDDKKVGQFKFLQDNLFCYSPNSLKIKQSDISLFEAKNFEEELIFCASKIRDLIIKEKYSFEDFFVAVSDLKSKKDIVKNVFEKYDFRFFLDVTTDFNLTIVPIFLNNVYELIQDNFSIKNVVAFLKSPIFSIDRELIDDFEDYILKFNIDEFFRLKSINFEDEFYDNFNLLRQFFFDTIQEFYSLIKDAKTFNDFIFAFEKLFEKISLEERLNQISIKLANEGNLKQAKMFEQYYNSVVETFDDLVKVLGAEECDLKTFMTTLNSGFSSIKISTTPLSINSIFVGDCSVSFFESRKILFVLNACEEDFPKTVNDCGMISDEDIKEVSHRYKLEPSISDINKKERFKVYELLLKPKQKLFLSYNYNNKTKSKILDDISKMFVVESGSKFNTLPFLTFEKVDFLTKNNTYKVAKSNLVNSFRAIFDGQKLEEKNDDILYFSLKENLKESFLDNFEYKNIIKLNNNVFFLNNKTSISQIETYMICPFLHFVRYGLKLQEKVMGEIDNLNIGNIIHELANNLFRKITLPNENELVKKTTLQIFDNILDRDEFRSIKSNTQNKILISNLKQECLRFSFALNEQAKKTKFKPTYFEIRFDENNLIKGVKFRVKDKIISLVGQVDRIDIFEDFFRIIDYKTGKCDTSFKELFFGKKIQLEAYLKVVSSSLKLKSVGAYYLPIKSSFSDTKTSLQAKYQLKGRTLLDDKVINASDKGFENYELKSEVVEVKFNKNDDLERTLNAFSKVIDSKNLQKICDYAFSLIQNTLKDILQLDITPTPLCLGSDDPCKNCKYFGICRFDPTLSNVKRKPEKKVELKDFDEEESNGNK